MNWIDFMVHGVLYSRVIFKDVGNRILSLKNKTA